MSGVLSLRVAARFQELTAKSQLLLPEFSEALQELKNSNSDPMIAFIKRVVAILVPGEKVAPWYYALGTAKRNAVMWLHKEGSIILANLPSTRDFTNPESAPRFNSTSDPRDSANKIRDYYVLTCTVWGKKLRTLEIALQSEDEEKHIKHGPFTLVRIAGLTQSDVNGALEALDAAADKIRDKFPQVLYGTIFLSPHLGSKRAASYVFAEDNIQLDVHARKRFSDMQTLIHEFGHRFDHKFFKNKELRERFARLSVEKVVETIRYDEKLRRAVAEEALQFAKAKKDGGVMPNMSDDLARWIKSPRGVGSYIKTVMTNYLSGKFDEQKVISAVMGHLDQDVETGKLLHAPLHVTPYGGTNPRENFAEAFAFYVLGLDMPAELADIMAQLHRGA